MKTGVCPKCQLRTVRGSDNGIGVNGTALSIRIGLFRRAYFRVFICTSCGYTEQYLLDTEGRNAVREHWPKIV
jgi:predicted nucleic-acid-binding Zn-ribbon protein